jgi:hypothetical protein
VIATANYNPASMSEKLKPSKHSWQLVAHAAPRVVFAAFEQMCGTPPYRFEVVDANSARAVEVERKGFFGQWAKLAKLDKEGREKTASDGTPVWKRPVTWIRVTTAAHDDGTLVTVESSAGRFTAARAMQLLQLLDRGNADRRTVYRDRRVPPGPVTLVASWAGMLYHVYTEPRYYAPRGPGVHTASHLTALGAAGAFIHVRLEDGTEGYIETDQLVASPVEATRDAQVRTAVEQERA